MSPGGPAGPDQRRLRTTVAGRFRLDAAHDMRVLTITGMAVAGSASCSAPAGRCVVRPWRSHSCGAAVLHGRWSALVGAPDRLRPQPGLTGLGLEPVWEAAGGGRAHRWRPALGRGVRGHRCQRCLPFAAAPDWSTGRESGAGGGPAGGRRGTSGPSLVVTFALTNGEMEVESIVTGPGPSAPLSPSSQFAGDRPSADGGRAASSSRCSSSASPAANRSTSCAEHERNRAHVVALSGGAVRRGDQDAAGPTLVIAQMAGLALVPTALAAR